MDLERFGNSPVGRLVPIEGYDTRFGERYEHKAYVPAPLPTSVALSGPTINAVSEAMLALGRLDAAVERLPNPNLLVRGSIRTEAVSTSALEGTYAAFTDLLQADFLDEDDLSRPVSEVHNFVVAAERGLEMIQERPISRGMLCDLHRILVRGTRADTYEAGALRQRPVVIGPDGCRIFESRFVPCPHGDLLEDGVSDWEKWINAEDDLPLLVKVALGHYQFETLHPFNDGNGRLGRLVAILQMIEARALHHPMLNISPWLEVRRTAYVDHLAEVSATGNFDPWVGFICEAVRAQSADGVQRVDRLLAVREQMVSKLRAGGVRSVAIPIAGSLIGFPVITPTSAASLHDVSYQSANTAIGRLVDFGILEQLGETTYNRLFVAPEVIRILQ